MATIGDAPRGRGWRGVVDWRKVWARAISWGGGIELGPYGLATAPVTGGASLELIELGYRAVRARDRETLEVEHRTCADPETCEHLAVALLVDMS